MAEDFSGITADEARARLVRDGANMLPEMKQRLTAIAAGRDIPSANRPPMAAVGFSGAGRVSAIPVEEWLASEPDETDVVLCEFPKALEIALPDQRRIKFHLGIRPVPRRFLEPEMHLYFKHNGVERVDGRGQPSPPPAPDRSGSFPADHAAQMHEMDRVIVDQAKKLARASADLDAREADLEKAQAEVADLSKKLDAANAKIAELSKAEPAAKQDDKKADDKKPDPQADAKKS